MHSLISLPFHIHYSINLYQLSSWLIHPKLLKTQIQCLHAQSPCCFPTPMSALILGDIFTHYDCNGKANKLEDKS